MMERFFQREDRANGKLTIEFTDAAHLADAWNFAEKNNLKTQFEEYLIHLIRIALGGAVPQPGYKGEMTELKALPGKAKEITIEPDGRDVPSFVWFIKDGLHGGLIYHQSSKSWGIHT